MGLHCADVCVCIRPTILAALIERPRVLAWHVNVLGCCQSAALATVAETAQGFEDTRHLTCHSSYGLTINGRLLADRTKLYTADEVET